MNIGRVEQVAAKLISQQVLVVGGIDPSGFSENSAELYQPPVIASPMVVATPTPTVKPSATATRKATPTPSKTPTPTKTADSNPHPDTDAYADTVSNGFADPGTRPSIHQQHSSHDPAGSSLVIDGSNFTAGSEVNLFVATGGGVINGGPLIPIARTLPTQLTVNVPATVPLGRGFVEVQVVNTDTGFLASNSVPALLQGSPAAGIPSITSINTVGLAATSSDPSYATNNVETVVVQGKTVALGGMGFETSTPNGVAVNLFCACPGGKVGPCSSPHRGYQHVDKLHAARHRSQCTGDQTGIFRGQ